MKNIYISEEIKKLPYIALGCIQSEIVVKDTDENYILKLLIIALREKMVVADIAKQRNIKRR